MAHIYKLLHRVELIHIEFLLYVFADITKILPDTIKIQITLHMRVNSDI